MNRVLTFLVLCMMAVPASAHEWYTDKKDPVMGSCCSGIDCGKWIIAPGQITGEGEGFRVRLTREQVLSANPHSKITHIDQYFPLSRVIPSEDGNWHVCPKFAGQPDNAIRCLMAPANM